MSYPETKDEWWQSVDTNWKRLKTIVMNYYPNQQDFPKDGWPLPYPKCEAPQRACNTVIKSLRKEQPIWQYKGSLDKYITALKENRDSKLASIFESSWFGIPESPSSRCIPGFFVFCDLCSERYVLND